eukprot:2812585-Amphidinium_carterae.1
MCDIAGETIPEEPALNLTLLLESEITEDDGCRKIRTRYVYDAMKQKTRLVLQDIRKGATRPEDYSPTPSLTGMRACSLMTAKAGHGASVCNISSAFLYTDLPKDQQVACYSPNGTPGSKDHSGMQIPYL